MGRRIVKYLIALVAAVVIGNIVITAFAQLSALERSRELIEEDKALRERIEKGEKVFVKTIIVKSGRKLSDNEIKDIFAPFEGRWITGENVRQIIDSLKSAYQKKVIAPVNLKVTYEIKKNDALEITVKEVLSLR